MTTVVPFLPSNLFVPSFVAIFDGVQHRVYVTWNVSAQRYYVNIYTLTNDWIITIPLVATPPARRLEHMFYNKIQGVMYARFVPPDEWPVPLPPAGLVTAPGTVVDYTLENFTPSVLNQTFRSLHIDPLTFSFAITPNPGEVSLEGTVSRYMNMIGGVFKNSTFIYRNGAFEITP